MGPSYGPNRFSIDECKRQINFGLAEKKKERKIIAVADVTSPPVIKINPLLLYFLPSPLLSPQILILNGDDAGDSTKIPIANRLLPPSPAGTRGLVERGRDGDADRSVGRPLRQPQPGKPPAERLERGRRRGELDPRRRRRREAEDGRAVQEPDRHAEEEVQDGEGQALSFVLVLLREARLLDRSRRGEEVYRSCETGGGEESDRI